jgi:hypothetical protein
MGLDDLNWGGFLQNVGSGLQQFGQFSAQKKAGDLFAQVASDPRFTREQWMQELSGQGSMVRQAGMQYQNRLPTQFDIEKEDLYRQNQQFQTAARAQKEIDAQVKAQQQKISKMQNMSQFMGDAMVADITAGMDDSMTREQKTAYLNQRIPEALKGLDKRIISQAGYYGYDPTVKDIAVASRDIRARVTNKLVGKSDPLGQYTEMLGNIARQQAVESKLRAKDLALNKQSRMVQKDAVDFENALRDTLRLGQGYNLETGKLDYDNIPVDLVTHEALGVNPRALYIQEYEKASSKIRASFERLYNSKERLSKIEFGQQGKLDISTMPELDTTISALIPYIKAKVSENSDLLNVLNSYGSYQAQAFQEQEKYGDRGISIENTAKYNSGFNEKDRRSLQRVLLPILGKWARGSIGKVIIQKVMENWR